MPQRSIFIRGIAQFSLIHKMLNGKKILHFAKNASNHRPRGVKFSQSLIFADFQRFTKQDLVRVLALRFFSSHFLQSNKSLGLLGLALIFLESVFYLNSL